MKDTRISAAEIAFMFAEKPRTGLELEKAIERYGIQESAAVLEKVSKELEIFDSKGSKNHLWLPGSIRKIILRIKASLIS